jgi:HipA-like protein
MVFAIRQFLARLGEGEASSSDSVLRETQFVLRYGKLEVGRLTCNESGWQFEYSDAFKSQNRVQPLADFPRKDKTYKMGELWPFFVSRIPSLEQPQVKQILLRENIDRRDKAALLSRFGGDSITNSFKLVEA